MQKTKNTTKKITTIFVTISFILSIVLISTSILNFIEIKNRNNNLKTSYNEINNQNQQLNDLYQTRIQQKNQNQNMADFLQKEKKDTQEQINYSIDNISKLNSKLNNLSENITITDSYLSENLSILADLKTGNKYTLHNPTFKEAVSFLENNTYSDCSNVVNQAKNQGIRSAYVSIYIEIGTCGCIAFETLDEGLVFFECSSDYRVFPEIGKKYYNCVEGTPYGPSKPYYEDEIEEILVMW